MLKQNYTVLVFLAATTLAASQATPVRPGTDWDSAVQLKKIESTAFPSQAGKRIADSMADFGFELHKAVTEKGTDTTTSPFSLTSAFGLVANGARNATYADVTGALRLGGMKLDEFDQGYEALSQSLRQTSKGNVLSFGNAVFADLDFPVRDSYLARVKQSMGASGENVNFKKPEEAADHINGYIEDHTEKMIRKMVTPEAVQGWRAALVNAGYFKGSWAFKFDARMTRENADFTTANGTKKVPMMRQYGKTFLYHRGNGFQMASLAYQNGDFAMDLIVPDRSADAAASLAAVESQLTGANYRSWIAASRPTRIILGLPRFETSFTKDLTGYFKKAMPLAFSDSADFLGLSPESVKVDAVIHATKLKVNEEGTEGAFATVIGMVTTSVRPMPVLPEVVADRPFVMVIRHTATGTPIFVSTISDPTPLAKP